MVSRTGWVSGVLAPVIFIAVILTADFFEGPKTAFVGVLAVVPMFSAVFGTPLMTAIVAVITLLSGWAFGLTASDGNVAAQNVRLVVIALVSIIAVGAAITRRRLQRQLTDAQVAAARLEIIEQQAYTDSMTGLLNRRGLAKAIAALPPGNRSIVVLDCDHLKDVNDSFGHAVGDEYIIAIAKRLQNALSSRDPIGRWGGDEFIAILGVSADEARSVVERMMSRISDASISTSAGEIHATVSAGLADWIENVSLDTAVALADKAMYESKAQGVGKLSTAGL